MLAGYYNFSAEVLPSQNWKQELHCKAKCKAGGIFLFSLLTLAGVQSTLILFIKNRGVWVQVDLHLLGKIHFKHQKVIYFVNGLFLSFSYLCCLIYLFIFFEGGSLFYTFRLGFFNLYLVLGFAICNPHQFRID